MPEPLHPSAHEHLSTGCLHGDMVLPDGRTGHEYCQGDTGHAGSKRPAECKFCGARCICPCHPWNRTEHRPPESEGA